MPETDRKAPARAQESSTASANSIENQEIRCGDRSEILENLRHSNPKDPLIADPDLLDYGTYALTGLARHLPGIGDPARDYFEQRFLDISCKIGFVAEEKARKDAAYNEALYQTLPDKWKFGDLLFRNEAPLTLQFSDQKIRIDGVEYPETLYRAALTFGISLSPEALEADRVFFDSPYFTERLQTLLAEQGAQGDFQVVVQALKDLSSQSQSPDDRAFSRLALIAAIDQARIDGLGTTNDALPPFVRPGDSVNLVAALKSYHASAMILREEREKVEQRERAELAEKSNPAPAPGTFEARVLQANAWIERAQDRYPDLGRGARAEFRAILLGLQHQESSFDPSARNGLDTGSGQIRLGASARECLRLANKRDPERWPLNMSDKALETALLDGEKNTELSAIYLDHLIKRFGDTEVGLMAYNRGPTTVSALRSELGSEAALRARADNFGYVKKVTGYAAIHRDNDILASR